MFIEISEELASDPWFKPEALVRNPHFLPELGSGQHHWAVLVEQKELVLAVFYGDARGVFDEIAFESRKDAEISLVRNGFSKYIESPKLHQFISLPSGEFHEGGPPYQPIYSSGQAWMFIEISEELASDPWFKVADFLQVNWAVIIEKEDAISVVFYGDTRGVFDEIIFETKEGAESALVSNGFSRYIEDSKAQEFIGLPRGKFHKKAHPKGAIYSSGEYWE